MMGNSHVPSTRGDLGVQRSRDRIVAPAASDAVPEGRGNW
jgi:hypothetical protein